MTKYCLSISTEADYDLANLYEDGFIRWGEAQADQYYDDILSHFELLCDNPYLYRSVDEIREGYRRSVCGKHSIYYRIMDDTVEIMALVKHENRYSDYE
ncbi:MAG: type II toxin-antitoxin system RelE/ParE family toxin [Proteobacteria bacterium]|nr:type II toxin-antitoxin system RelE/ParE family toxin [Pseudomonadota bacterium]